MLVGKSQFYMLSAPFVKIVVKLFYHSFVLFVSIEDMTSRCKTGSVDVSNVFLFTVLNLYKTFFKVNFI